MADQVSSVEFSMADQMARFARAKLEGNARVLDIDSVYDPRGLAGLRVVVTGAEQGLGLETIRELAKQGAHAIAVGRTSSPELDALAQLFPATPTASPTASPTDSPIEASSPSMGSVQVVTGVDVTKTESMEKMVNEVGIGGPVDWVINNAGYFYGPEESVGDGGAEEGHLNFEEELRMLDVCAVGPLRVTSALFKAGLLIKGDGHSEADSEADSEAAETNDDEKEEEEEEEGASEAGKGKGGKGKGGKGKGKGKGGKGRGSSSTTAATWVREISKDEGLLTPR